MEVLGSHRRSLHITINRDRTVASQIFIQLHLVSLVQVGRMGVLRHTYHHGHGVSIETVVHQEAVVHNLHLTGSNAVQNHLRLLRGEDVARQLEVHLHIAGCLGAQVLQGQLQLTAIVARDGGTFIGHKHIVGHLQARHGIFQRVDHQLGGIGIEAVGFECVDINLGQGGRHILLHQIAKGVLLGSTGQDITAIQFARTIEKFIITLLFGEAETEIIGIALTPVLNGKLYSKAFAGINHLIIITIYEAVDANHQHGRFQRYRHRSSLGLGGSLRLLHLCHISFQAFGEGVEGSPVRQNLRQHLVFRLHLHEIIHTGQSLHVHLSRGIFLQDFQEQILGIQQIARGTLTDEGVLSVVGNLQTTVGNLRGHIKVRTRQAGHILEIVGFQRIEALEDFQSFLVLLLNQQDTRLDRQHLHIVRINLQDTVNGGQQLRHIVGGNMHIHQIVEEVQRNGILGDGLLQDLLLLHIVLLGHVYHVQIDVAVLLLRLVADTEVFLEEVGSLRVLLLIVGRLGSKVDHHRIVGSTRQQFILENLQLGQFNVSSRKVKPLHRILLAGIVDCCIE